MQPTTHFRAGRECRADVLRRRRPQRAGLAGDGQGQPLSHVAGSVRHTLPSADGPSAPTCALAPFPSRPARIPPKARPSARPGEFTTHTSPSESYGECGKTNCDDAIIRSPNSLDNGHLTRKGPTLTSNLERGQEMVEVAGRRWSWLPAGEWWWILARTGSGPDDPEGVES
jgi:hypothetical protein